MAAGEGASVLSDQALTVYTTRPDTLFGATYMVVAPEHPMLTVRIAVGVSLCGMYIRVPSVDATAHDAHGKNCMKAHHGVYTRARCAGTRAVYMCMHTLLLMQAHTCLPLEHTPTPSPGAV